MVSAMVSVAVLMTETVSCPTFVTYALVPSGENTIFRGPDPTGIVLMTVLVAVSMTDSV